MSDKPCIIVGASHAAAQLSATLRKRGWQNGILVIGEEPYLPYNRPPLSKTFLAGEKEPDDLLLRHAESYEKAGIEFMLETRVVEIRRREKQVVTSDGQVLDYGKLALTLGASPRTLNIPGADLDGVLYLRDIRDAGRIRPYVKAGKRAVIVGGGYIGLEAAAMFRRLGMDVTILERDARILHRVSAPEVAGFFTRIHREEGVNIHCGIDVTRFESDGSELEVVCGNGGRFRADLVLVAIGVAPNTALASKAGIDVNDGIVVDAHCRTSDVDIVAAGDCTQFFSPFYHTDIRLESVQNAVDQARVAASTVCGIDVKYQELPWFWSDQYDLKLQIAGLSRGYDELLVRGDIDTDRKFAVFFFHRGALIAVDAVNSPQEFMFGKRAISEGISLDRERLRDPGVPMRDLLWQED